MNDRSKEIMDNKKDKMTLIERFNEDMNEKWNQRWILRDQ